MISRTPVPKAARVPAYLVVPTGPGPFAAIIYAHWCMPGSPQMNRTEYLAEAIALAHSGVVSLLLDDVSVRRGFVKNKSPLNEQQSDVLVQQVMDIRRAADLLLTRRDIDPKRLACVGHSCNGSTGVALSVEWTSASKRSYSWRANCQTKVSAFDQPCTY